MEIILIKFFIIDIQGMSIVNFYTDGVKSWQNLNVNSISAQDIIASSMESTDLLVSGVLTADIYKQTESGIFDSRAWNTRTLLDISADTATPVTNYDIAQDGDLVGFDRPTGIFTAPEAGTYYAEIKVTRTAVGAGVTAWNFLVHDPVSLNQFYNASVTLNGQSTDYPGGVYQGGFVTALNAGEQMLVVLKPLLAQTGCFVRFRIVRLF